MTRSTVLVTAALLVGAALGSAGGPERRYLKRMDDPVRGPLPFSDGVLVGDTLYLAGKLGLDPNVEMHSGSEFNDSMGAARDMLQ